MPDFVAGVLPAGLSLYGGSLWKKASSRKIKSVLWWCGSFSGEKSMREAFEQLIERQTCEHFEEWLEQHEMAENAA